MVILKIRKRDGSLVEFKQQRITDAIHKALLAVNLEDGKVARKISNEVVKILSKKFVKRIPSVEDVHLLKMSKI
jgi:anaerobic ribonucleoside-triphosphate reductase